MTDIYCDEKGQVEYNDLSENDKAEIELLKKELRGDMTPEEQQEYMMPTREFTVNFKIPIFLLDAMPEFDRQTNPNLSQDAAMLLFFLKDQIKQALAHQPTDKPI